jgi:adenosine deaminase
MNALRSTSLVITSLMLASCATFTKEMVDASDYEKTNNLYQSMLVGETLNVAKLNLFFTQMPKGGDIHHHYSGSVYAETYIDWVGLKNWSINSCTSTIVTVNPVTTGDCPDLTVPELLKNDTAYRKLLTLWSDKDYANHFHNQPAPDTNFFETFDYFGAISHEYTGKGLQIIKARAKKENVGYIETMLSTAGASSKDFFSADDISTLIIKLRAAKNYSELQPIFESMRTQLEKQDSFNKTVTSFVASTQQYHQDLDDDEFTMRYQTYGVRVLNPVQIFTDLLSGFMAAEKSPLIVGVNLLAPENNVVALQDYTLQMYMFQYMNSLHPEVKRALHAGELTLGMVRPRNLNFHINQALNIAKAQRIGHGVDIPYEQDSVSLLSQLKDKAAIEINLTSNQFILGVEKQNHPYTIYASYGVPLVISTDDSGVSRNNLSNEFMLLASRYKPSYSTVKEYAYNSIRYSFMSETDKQVNITRLDKDFIKFEHEMAKLSAKMGD